MASSSQKSAYWSGFITGIPHMLVVGPFGVLFGVIATEAGLRVYETLLFSIAVIAGAAQFTALQLIKEDAPTVIVILSALAVNLRMAMYSASFAPYLGGAPLWKRACIAYVTIDQTFAMSYDKFERETQMSLQQRVAFFFGTATPMIVIWYSSTLFGALIGRAVPAGLPLDFAIPITFLGLIVPMMRTLPHVIGASVALIMSLALSFMPFSTGVLLAGLIGMAAAAETERRMAKP